MERRERLRRILAEVASLDPDEIDDTTDFYETLGLEVVTVREFLNALEGHYGLSIAEEDLPRITSLDRLVRYLELKSN